MTPPAEASAAARPANDFAADAAEARRAGKERLFAAITASSKYLNLIGLGFLTPVFRMAAGESPAQQMKEMWRLLGLPVLSVLLFLAVWAQIAPGINTSLGSVPGPAQVWAEAVNLWEDHKGERAKETAFYERQDARNARYAAQGKHDRIKERAYTGKPTYVDQIFTSLRTVFMGFLLATLIAVPLGILSGLSATMHALLNPLIQVFKPVSPLAWLPIVTMVVSALYVSDDPLFDKAFLNSAITVTLCSLWPTLINTALGVASVDKDLVNVSRVLRLDWSTKIWRLIIPSSLPLIFTGLRLSLGVGWMVLIAAEMLAQNPGLGKFVWDEFQNGSSSSLAKMLVAVLTIGVIGFLLDRLMYALQGLLTFGDKR